MYLSTSMVNLMCYDRLFRCVKNSSSYSIPCLHIAKMSSTYLFQSFEVKEMS